MTIDLYNGDCLEVMQTLIDKGVKVDAVITDPPYEFNLIGGCGKGELASRQRKRNFDLIDLGLNKGFDNKILDILC